jgi:putative transposase
MGEAAKQFCRVNGHLHLPALLAALAREFAEPAGPDPDSRSTVAT